MSDYKPTITVELNKEQIEMLKDSLRAVNHGFALIGMVYADSIRPVHRLTRSCMDLLCEAHEKLNDLEQEQIELKLP